MRWPPEAAVSCPQSDIIGVLDRLEGLTRVRYCRSCFGVGQRRQCSAVPRQAPGPTAALWVPPTVSYATMVSTETTASTSAAGVTPLSHLLPEMPAPEAMDTLPAPSMENLLATAGVGRGRKPRTQPRTPAAPGLHQMRPRMPQQQAPTPRGQEVMQVMPYQQQVFPPRCTAPKQSATLVPARFTGTQPEKRKVPEVGPHPEGLRTGKEGTNPPPENPGSADRGAPSDSLMDQMANYVASGWK